MRNNNFWHNNTFFFKIELRPYSPTKVSQFEAEKTGFSVESRDTLHAHWSNSVENHGTSIPHIEFCLLSEYIESGKQLLDWETYIMLFWRGSLHSRFASRPKTQTSPFSELKHPNRPFIYYRTGATLPFCVSGPEIPTSLIFASLIPRCATTTPAACQHCSRYFFFYCRHFLCWDCGPQTNYR